MIPVQMFQKENCCYGAESGWFCPMGVADSRYELISVGIDTSFKFLQNHTAIQQRPHVITFLITFRCGWFRSISSSRNASWIGLANKWLKICK
jgi:hypothetical protein